MTEPSQYFKGRTVQEQMNEVIGYVDTKAAEVATDAIAADVAQVHQDMLDADADASAAAASAAAAAGTLANAVKKTGEASQSIAGDIAVAGTLSGGVVTGTVITAPTPVNNTDAASKKYVDDADALKMNIADVNSYAVGLTGNQGPIGGYKEFVDNRSAGSLPSGAVTSPVNGYACVLKIPHTKNNTVRQHILVWCAARQRDDAGAVLAIYTNNGAALGLTALVAPPGTARTYTLTDDGDNLYLYLVGTNSNNDLLQTAVIARMEFGALSVDYMNNVIESSPLGTVVKTVTVGI